MQCILSVLVQESVTCIDVEVIDWTDWGPGIRNFYNRLIIYRTSSLKQIHNIIMTSVYSETVNERKKPITV